ncbi:hypothetical protein ILYODFUR_029538 [Ilyodon furcidens]|uniref:Uncharacterized protein n=1 Tax=Ilyodon furcidens TaxID=33524 RepID=A0ABV0SRL4_9TELE
MEHQLVKPWSLGIDRHSFKKLKKAPSTGRDVEVGCYGSQVASKGCGAGVIICLKVLLPTLDLPGKRGVWVSLVSKRVTSLWLRVAKGKVLNVACAFAPNSSSGHLGFLESLDSIQEGVSLKDFIVPLMDPLPMRAMMDLSREV